MSRSTPHMGPTAWLVGAVAIWLVAVASASGTSAASTDAPPVKAQPAAVQSGMGHPRRPINLDAFFLTPRALEHQEGSNAIRPHSAHA